MTDATDFTSIPRVAKTPQVSVPLSAPVPFGAPVLISDCVNPLAGETLLSLLWKRMARDDDTTQTGPDRHAKTKS